MALNSCENMYVNRIIGWSSHSLTNKTAQNELLYVYFLFQPGFFLCAAQIYCVQRPRQYAHSLEETVVPQCFDDVALSFLPLAQGCEIRSEQGPFCVDFAFFFLWLCGFSPISSHRQRHACWANWWPSVVICCPVMDWQPVQNVPDNWEKLQPPWNPSVWKGGWMERTIPLDSISYLICHWLSQCI